MLNRRTLVAAAATAAALAPFAAVAQFAERTIKFTNGVNEDHPVGLGVKKMQEVLAARTGGKRSRHSGGRHCGDCGNGGHGHSPALNGEHGAGSRPHDGTG